MSISKQTVSHDTDCELTVINMCGEDFIDAMFFFDMSKKTAVEDEFEKRRFLRAALVFFCATAEAWARQKITCELRAKENRTPDEENILNKLESRDEKPLFWKVEEIFKEKIPNICKVQLDEKQLSDVDKYISLATIRNGFVHYSGRADKELYSISILEEAVREAPEIIIKLIEPYEDINKVCWYQNTMKKYSS